MIEGSKILLVDDSPEIVQLLCDFLAAYNCEIYKASTGAEATDLLSTKTVEMAIIDVKLPDTNGITLLEKMRLHDPNIAVVMITGYNDPDLIIDAMKKGASDFLMKPFHFDKLMLSLLRVKKQRELLVERSTILSDLEDKKKIEVLNRQLQKQIAQLTTMHHISNRFSSFNIFEDIYEKTIGVVDEVMSAESCGYYIVDHESSQLLLYKKRADRKPIEEKVSLTADLLQEIMSGKKCFTKGDKTYLPLAIKNECVGVIMMGRKGASQGKAAALTDDDMFFLKLISDKASMQVENRMLYESLFEGILHTLTSLIMAINRRDMYTEGHCQRVAEMGLMLADEMGASDYERDVIRVVAPIHDVGKIGIPDSVLLKPGKLTDDEYDLMKSHPIYGEEIINRFDLLSNEASITRHHHERCDGRGYPDGLAGDEIPFCSRLIAVCDTYDAMTSNRPYRKALSREEALKEILRCRGNQLDSTIVDCFLEMVTDDRRHRKTGVL
jgi:response regulator RpfG family c-di-GMP phosphodiesterase